MFSVLVRGHMWCNREKATKKKRSQTDCPATLNGPKNRYVATANSGPSTIREMFTDDWSSFKFE